MSENLSSGPFSGAQINVFIFSSSFPSFLLSFFRQFTAFMSVFTSSSFNFLCLVLLPSLFRNNKKLLLKSQFVYKICSYAKKNLCYDHIIHDFTKKIPILHRRYDRDVTKRV